MRRTNPAWAEAIQLLPVISLALPFILQGEVDLDRALPGFLLGSALTVPVMLAVRVRGHALNPITVGTALWLWIGALAFGVPVEPLAAWMSDTRGFGLFAAVLLTGGVATVGSPSGFVGVGGADPAWIRRHSVGLLALTVVAVGWAWWFRHDIRLGGGLPFIVLNVARRVVIARG